MLASILKLNALLPAIIPWMVFFTVHKQRHEEPFFRERFDKEYDYIVGKCIIINWTIMFDCKVSTTPIKYTITKRPVRGFMWVCECVVRCSHKNACVLCSFPYIILIKHVQS